MKFIALAAAVSLALAAGCDRAPSTPPSPRTDNVSSVPSAAAGSSTTPANAGTPTTADKKQGSNPVQQQIDPKQGDQHRDFKHPGESAGPKSSDTQPTTKN